MNGERAAHGQGLFDECEHEWRTTGYQMQADPPQWLECCLRCPAQRLTAQSPGRPA